jgi:DNA-binding response OmpR family regulator
MNQTVTVLIVDDDPDVLFATSRMVRNAGYPVLEASSGVACMEIVRDNRPDLILLDVVLPDASGVELCRQIKADPHLAGIFVVLVSGQKTTTIEQADGLDTGADGYISRPVSNRELVARINSMVRILMAERERDQLIVELKNALEKVKKLNGLLPICMHCKSIRDDKGYWRQIENYIQDHSEAEFTHSICQKCARKLYPGIEIYED